MTNRSKQNIFDHIMISTRYTGKNEATVQIYHFKMRTSRIQFVKPAYMLIKTERKNKKFSNERVNRRAQVQKGPLTHICEAVS